MISLVFPFSGPTGNMCNLRPLASFTIQLIQYLPQSTFHVDFGLFSVLLSCQPPRFRVVVFIPILHAISPPPLSHVKRKASINYFSIAHSIAAYPSTNGISQNRI